jgi:RNA polymerase sigma-70 factor, ECF subfamily
VESHLRIVRAAPAPAPPTFDDLFERFSPYVAVIAMRLLGSDDEVDDVVQDVFLACARQIHKIPDLDSGRGWLATVTVRAARRRLARRRLRRFLRLDPDPGLVSLAAEGLGPEEHLLLRRVYGVLRTLPASHQVAWALRHLQQEALDDVARACGCSLPTVKRRIAAAQAALEGALRDG